MTLSGKSRRYPEPPSDPSSVGFAATFSRKGEKDQIFRPTTCQNIPVRR